MPGYRACSKSSRFDSLLEPVMVISLCSRVFWGPVSWVYKGLGLKVVIGQI
jgi:hypothetical protein